MNFIIKFICYCYNKKRLKKKNMTTLIEDVQKYT